MSLAYKIPIGPVPSAIPSHLLPFRRRNHLSRLLPVQSNYSMANIVGVIRDLNLCAWAPFI
jgi:hypothetical protein